jgi:hypothetical protein
MIEVSRASSLLVESAVADIMATESELQCVIEDGSVQLWRRLETQKYRLPLCLSSDENSAAFEDDVIEDLG